MLMGNSGNPISLEGLENRVDPVGGSLGIPFRAVDWEYASRKGLPLFDFIFFSSMQAFLFKEKSLFPFDAACHLNNYLDKLGIAREKARTIIQLCMVRDWLRCQKTGDRARANFLMRMLAALPGEMP